VLLSHAPRLIDAKAIPNLSESTLLSGLISRAFPGAGDRRAAPPCHTTLADFLSPGRRLFKKYLAQFVAGSKPDFRFRR